jgi:hypothetical protein
MARFTEAGTYTVNIIGALLADAKFNTDQNAFDVCLEVKDPTTGAEDVWRGEFSNANGKGKVSHLTQRQLTVQSLEKIGWQFGEDFSQLPTLIGQTIQVGVTEYVGEKGTFYNVRYLGGGSSEKPEAINDFAQRMAALNSQGGFGQPQSQPNQQPVQNGFNQAPNSFTQTPQPVQNGFGQPIQQPVQNGFGQPIQQPVQNGFNQAPSGLTQPQQQPQQPPQQMQMPGMPGAPQQ